MQKNQIKVLVVDDVPQDVEVIQSMLATSSVNRYSIETADRLAGAFRTLRAGGFDIIFLDLFLPESKGIETLRKIRAKTAGVPIIALTRFDDEMIGASAVKEGAQDYLVKGQFDTELLHRTIQHAIERHRTEEAIRRKNLELEVLNKKLKEADRLKSVFLANMSHELRTPMNSIIGFTTIILKGMSGAISDDQRKQLGIVKKNAEHLLQLINEALDVSKIEAGKISLDCSTFNLTDLIKEIQVVFQPLIKKKDLYLKAETIDNCTLHTDWVRLRQILVNLTNNAVKFTNKGGVTVEARQTKNEDIVITIEDTGIGIKKEDMGMLFIPFHQLDMSRTKKYQGTGLGLHLSQKLAHLLGGSIKADSTFGQGSRFVLTIPRRHESAQAS